MLPKLKSSGRDWAAQRPGLPQAPRACKVSDYLEGHGTCDCLVAGLISQAKARKLELPKLQLVCKCSCPEVIITMGLKVEAGISASLPLTTKTRFVVGSYSKSLYRNCR